MRFLSGFIQFILGLILGLALLAGTGVAVAYYLLTQTAETPSKPLFPEEKPPTPSTAENSENEESPQSSPTPKQEEKAPVEEEKPAEEKLEPGAYRARVTWSEGLILRDEPTLDANRIGGLGFNWEIIVLEDSQDKKWQRVRVPESDQEGWIKGGNVEKIEGNGE